MKQVPDRGAALKGARPRRRPRAALDRRPPIRPPCGGVGTRDVALAHASGGSNKGPSK